MAAKTMFGMKTAITPPASQPQEAPRQRAARGA